MKAITLWGPWASLIAQGFKTTETRQHDRFASLQGERIAIHQGLSRAPLQGVLRLLRFVGASRAATWLIDHGTEAPRGYVLATAYVASAGWLDGTIQENLAACCPTDGLYGLRLTDLRALDEPERVRGAQGIWEWNGRDPFNDEVA